jgi:hypothetical protein
MRERYTFQQGDTVLVLWGTGGYHDVPRIAEVEDASKTVVPETVLKPVGSDYETSVGFARPDYGLMLLEPAKAREGLPVLKEARERHIARMQKELEERQRAEPFVDGRLWI